MSNDQKIFEIQMPSLCACYIPLGYKQHTQFVPYVIEFVSNTEKKVHLVTIVYDCLLNNPVNAEINHDFV